jgi:hypothetical protein
MDAFTFLQECLALDVNCLLHVKDEEDVDDHPILSLLPIHLTSIQLNMIQGKYEDINVLFQDMDLLFMYIHTLFYPTSEILHLAGELKELTEKARMTISSSSKKRKKKKVRLLVPADHHSPPPSPIITTSRPPIVVTTTSSVPFRDRLRMDRLIRRASTKDKQDIICMLEAQHSRALSIQDDDEVEINVMDMEPSIFTDIRMTYIHLWKKT